MVLDEPIFKEGIKHDGHMAYIVHPDTEAILACEECFHILYFERWHAKQMTCIGTSRNACQLSISKTTAQRERCMEMGIKSILARKQQRS